MAVGEGLEPGRVVDDGRAGARRHGEAPVAARASKPPQRKIQYPVTDAVATEPAPRRNSPFSGASPAAWWALATLIAVGLYMYADRMVLTLQTDPVKASLHLSDFQI